MLFLSSFSFVISRIIISSSVAIYFHNLKKQRELFVITNAEHRFTKSNNWLTPLRSLALRMKISFRMSYENLFFPFVRVPTIHVPYITILPNPKNLGDPEHLKFLFVIIFKKKPSQEIFAFT